MSDIGTEAPITTTLKGPESMAPWIVIRSGGLSQLQQQLSELMSSSIFGDLGRAQSMFEAQYHVGKNLGGRGATPAQDGGAFGNLPEGVSVQQPQQAAPQYQEPVQAQNQYQQPQQQYQQPAQQNQYQQPQAQQQQQPQAAPPGAPLVNGQPAKLVSGSKNGRNWQAWADPRPKEVTDGMQRTDDPNDPGLANGTKSLWKFIR